MIPHTLELRRYLIARIIERGGAASVANLVDDLADAGFEVAGRPSKTVSDALRPDVTRHRLVRLERGVYAEATIARSTRYRILAVARSLRSAAALCTVVRLQRRPVSQQCDNHRANPSDPNPEKTDTNRATSGSSGPNVLIRPEVRSCHETRTREATIRGHADVRAVRCPRPASDGVLRAPTT